MKQTTFAVILLAAVLSQSAFAYEYTEPFTYQQTLLTSDSSVDALPAMPRGRSTTLGGEITHVDTVRDELTLKIVGGRRMKVFFDARTQAYLDGKRIPLRDLSLSEHASVQTLLDGTNIFALSIHILSQTPAGDVHGTILNFNPQTMELTMTTTLLSDPFRLLLPADVNIRRAGQRQFTSLFSGTSDLVRGTLISATFQSDKNGRGEARQITILATPGSTFVFSGTLSSLDMHTGVLVVIDPRDSQSYRIFFNPARLSVAKNFHLGDHIRVTAIYDGARYTARELFLN